MIKNAFKTKNKITTITYIILNLVFAVTFFVLLYRLIFETDQNNTSIRTDLILMLLQSLLGILSLQIPPLLEKLWRFDFSTLFILLYHAFLFCAIFLGEILRYYSKVAVWDDILHFSSGIMTGIFGYMLLSVIERNNKNRIKNTAADYGRGALTHPATLVLFAFCFAAAVGLLWEIYEFALDHFFDLNMQKYRLDDGTQFIGHAALTDTMKDIIIDAVGALVGALTGAAQFFKPKNTTKTED